MGRWLHEEVVYLRENASLSASDLCRKFGRSIEAVKFKAHSLGISLGRGNAPEWSWADQLHLRAFAGSGDKNIANLIGRTVGAVRFRAASDNISIRRKKTMLDAAEESAAIMEHDGGWPKLASEAMSGACQYMFNGECFHRLVALDYLRKNCPELIDLYVEDDRLATQVNLAKSAFDALGTLDDVRKIDGDLAYRFEQQIKLWENAKDASEREDHAGGMTRGYLALAERILNNG